MLTLAVPHARRTMLALVACFTVFLGIIFLTSSAYAVDRNVNDDGSGCPGAPPAGSYCTISAAVAASAAGDVILVDAGTYNEQVTVNKSVTIRGTGALQTVRQGFKVTAANVKITGFTINEGSFSGQLMGVLVQANGAYIAGNTLVGPNTGNGATGILVDAGANNVTIANNTLRNFYYGVYLYSGNGRRVISNTFGDLRSGLTLDTQTAAVVKFNTFSGPFHNQEGAIIVNNADTATVVAWNQFLAGGRVINHKGAFGGSAGTLNAENNWWNSQNGPARGAVVVTDGGVVDTTPFVKNRPSRAYDAVGEAFPGNVASLGFQATQTRELGDHIAFQPGVGRRLKSVKVMMSSWGCQSGVGPCVTTPGSSFTHDITLNIYAVAGSAATPAPGVRLLTVTQNFSIPFRPSADASCPNPTQFRDGDGVCNNGLAVPIVFDLSAQNVILPDQIIYGIAYNTSNHGYNPLTLAACNVNNTGCGYDSLNVGLRSFGPFAGTNVDPNSLFWNTTVLSSYTPPATTPEFRKDGGWAGMQPNVEFEVLPAVVTAGSDTLALSTGTYAFDVPLSLDVRGWPLNSLQFDVAWPACLSVNPLDDSTTLSGDFVVAYQPTPGNPRSTRVIVSPPLAPTAVIPNGLMLSLPFEYTGGTGCDTLGNKSYSFTPEAIVCGTNRATEGVCSGVTGSFVVDYNEPPVAVAVVPATVPENQPYAGFVTFTDPDGGPLTYSIDTGCSQNGGVNQNDEFVLNSDTGALTALEVDYELGEYNSRWVCVQANDGRGGLTRHAFQILVTNVKDMLFGDCNISGSVNVVDLSATVLEVFDEGLPGNGAIDFTDSDWLTAPYGDFRGSPEGCDSNQGTIVGAADIACTANIIFGVACGSAVGVSSFEPATLSIPALPLTEGDDLLVPVTLEARGNNVAAASFALRLPESATFDATDADGDGLPDAISFQVPDSLLRMAAYSATMHTVMVIVAGTSVPLPTFDGPLATIRLGGQVEPGTMMITGASAGDTNGQDIPVEVEVGPEIQVIRFTFLPSVVK